MPKVKQLAYERKEVAYAIIGQAILDEGDVGQTSIWIAYYSEDMARYLWEIADRWELANSLHVKVRKNGARVWSFTIKAPKRSDLYDVIGPLPDKRKDRAFRHLLIPQPSGKHKYRRGEAKRLILQKLQRNGPMTRRELMYELRIRGSTVARHLLQLKKKGSLEETMSGARFGRKQSSKLWRLPEVQNT